MTARQPAGPGPPAAGRPPQTRPQVVDAHAHHLSTGLPDWSRLTGDPRWPALARDDDRSGRIMCGDRVFRRVGAALWDLPTRLAELDAAGIDRQVIMPVPVTLTYWAGAKEAAEFTRELNDALAATVQSSGGRLVGLGAVPLQDVEAAVAELTRAVGELGLKGVEIGTTVAGRELDDPGLLPFFLAAEELGAALFIHPLDGGAGAIRRAGQPYDFGLGMPSDTAIAASALVFGGVLEKAPSLRVALAHGCGTFPWAYPRMRLAAQAFLDMPPAVVDAYTGRLWVDALVFDAEHLRLLGTRFGAAHVMMGTDHPFVPGQLSAAPALVATAVKSGLVTAQTGRDILGPNALAWLGQGNR